MLWIYVLHAPGETLRTSGSSSESQNLNTYWYNECCAALEGGKYLSCNCTGISHETPECSRIHCYNLCRSSSMFNTLITRAAHYVSKRSPVQFHWKIISLLSIVLRQRTWRMKSWTRTMLLFSLRPAVPLSIHCFWAPSSPLSYSWT